MFLASPLGLREYLKIVPVTFSSDWQDKNRLPTVGYANGSGSDNVPNDTLIVSSHALATENQIELVSSEMAAIVSALKRSGSANHHKKHWASISILTRDRSSLLFS
jgi:hypothetical protein